VAAEMNLGGCRPFRCSTAAPLVCIVPTSSNEGKYLCASVTQSAKMDFISHPSEMLALN
jgi:hypothetical protein